MVFNQAVLLLSAAVVCIGSPPCPEYGCEQQFLPAPPGKTPHCAKHGQTYCEYIDKYPTQLIKHLIGRWEYDYNTLFLNEDREPFRPRPVYGPPEYQQQHKTPVFSIAHFQKPPPLQHSSFNLVYNQSQDGYPDRKYPIGEPSLHFLNNSPEIYSALLRPDITSHEPWWKRYEPFVRKRRQSGSSTSLCPTSSQFIMPKAALNNQGNWMYVVNQDSDPRYTQFVLAETCRSTQCNGICSLPNGYSSRCEQQYVQKRLVALSGNGRMLYTDKFWLPHCCLCQITQNIR